MAQHKTGELLAKQQHPPAGGSVHGIAILLGSRASSSSSSSGTCCSKNHTPVVSPQRLCRQQCAAAKRALCQQLHMHLLLISQSTGRTWPPPSKGKHDFTAAATAAASPDKTQHRQQLLHLMSTILMTDALPILCRATMLSPLAQYRARLACSIAAARISSVVSVSVARAEPSASRGMRPRVMRHCRSIKSNTTQKSVGDG